MERILAILHLTFPVHGLRYLHQGDKPMANPVLSHPRFHEEQAAYDWVEAIVWENGRVCPHCGVVDRSGKLQGKTNRIGLYKCYACRKPLRSKSEQSLRTATRQCICGCRRCISCAA